MWVPRSRTASPYALAVAGLLAVLLTGCGGGGGVTGAPEAAGCAAVAQVAAGHPADKT
ncbi:MAG: hypothetical protein JWN57_2912, partial [Frankiales bacterium]|nr:hypothetical protein [Frankiales bacterium]